MGVISKDDLLDADENATIRSLEMAMLRKAVKSSEHFLSAIKLASQNSLSMVPVINDSQEWLGAIVNTELIKSCIAVYRCRGARSFNSVGNGT